MRIVSRELRQEQFDVVVSTGAAATLTALPQLLRPGKHVVYIESVSRFAGPSLTGRIMNAIPGTELYTQHASWADRKWKYHFSVLDEFGSVPAHAAPGSRPNVFVTLGTIRPYRFDRLVDQIVQIAPQAEIIWQLGETERADLPGKSHTYMSAGEFESTARAADVVISHAGVGTALRLLEMGICPVLVPRRRHFGEHVDDHQGQIADHLSDRNLAVVREASGLTWDDLMTAGSRQVVRAP
jgi:UDP-N-acetylglucosamine transferase subunit ALG13